MLVTSERFILAGGTFRAILANESHWLQPMLVLSVHWWPAPAGVGEGIIYEGPPHTRAKSHDYGSVRAQKKVFIGRPNTPPKSCSVVMDPQV